MEYDAHQIVKPTIKNYIVGHPKSYNAYNVKQMKEEYHYSLFVCIFFVSSKFPLL